MSMIDYGAIAFKNGKLINTEFFTPMKDTCGFSDEEQLLPKRDTKFDGNYLVVLGNRSFVIGFYKSEISWWADETDIQEDCYAVNHVWFDHILFDYGNFIKWSIWECNVGGVTITVKPRNGYYVCTFELDGDNYKVYFGYGVDLAWYRKTGFVNYYKTSPRYICRQIGLQIKEAFEDIKYKLYYNRKK